MPASPSSRHMHNHEDDSFVNPWHFKIPKCYLPNKEFTLLHPSLMMFNHRSNNPQGGATFYTRLLME